MRAFDCLGRYPESVIVTRNQETYVLSRTMVEIAIMASQDYPKYGHAVDALRYVLSDYSLIHAMICIEYVRTTYLGGGS